MSVLFDEYKILQDKIDKIGAFRFTIKGWAVTATIGIALATTAGRGLSAIVGSSAVNVLLIFFFFFEREQVRLGWNFAARARSIEIQFDRRRRASGKKLGFSTPNIARSSFGRNKPRADLFEREFPTRYLEKRRPWLNRQWRLARTSDILFYLILVAASWLPIRFEHKFQPQSTPLIINNTLPQPPPTPCLPSADRNAPYEQHAAKIRPITSRRK